MKKNSMKVILKNILFFSIATVSMMGQANAVGNFLNLDKKDLNKAPTISQEHDGDVLYEFDTFTVKFDDKKTEDNKQKEILDFLKENKALGKVEVSSNGKIEFDGAYGEIEAKNFTQFKSKFLSAKKQILGKHNIKKVGNYDIILKNYKKQFSKQQLKEIAQQIVGEEGTVIIFRQEVQDDQYTAIAYGENSKGKASYVFLEDLDYSTIKKDKIEEDKVKISTKNFLQ